MELIPEREGGEALEVASGPVPFREMQVCCFIVQPMSFRVDEATGAPIDLQEDRGFLCIVFVFATLGGFVGSSWSSKIPFFGRGKGKQSLILQLGVQNPSCVQNLLMAALYPQAVYPSRVLHLGC